jgi:hypothetical protein
MSNIPKMSDDIDVKFFKETGYYIKKVLDENEANNIADISIKDICDMIFRFESNPPDPDLIETTHLFTDYDLRKILLENPKCVWVNGNTRTPKISKSCGLVNQYLNREIHDNIHFNPKIYNILSTLYNNNKLAYIKGYDRFSIKPYKSTDMPRCINRHLFKNKNNHHIMTNIQAVLCARKPKDVKPRDGGAFELIPYFHDYFKLISVLCDPIEGPLAMTGDIEKDSLPQQLGKQFDIILPKLNNYIYQYTQLYNYFYRNIPAEIDEIETSVYNILEKYRIRVPSTWHELLWKTIDLNPGELLAFDTRIPYRNFRNMSKIPSVFFYITLCPIPDNFYNSSEHSTLLKTFYEGKMGDWNTSYGNNNIEEYEWRKENCTLSKCINVKNLSDFVKRLLTIEQYPLSRNNLSSKNSIFPVNIKPIDSQSLNPNVPI